MADFHSMNVILNDPIGILSTSYGNHPKWYLSDAIKYDTIGPSKYVSRQREFNFSSKHEISQIIIAANPTDHVSTTLTYIIFKVEHYNKKNQFVILYFKFNASYKLNIM
nr:hypothetical protein Iba_chr10eCG12480 [Ipomoea batatas]